MKHLFEALLLEEKLKETPDKKKVQHLQQVLLGDISIKEFVDTGMIMTVDTFLKSYVLPPPIHLKCKDVMVYIGRNYIQFLSDGNYLFDYDKGLVKKTKRIDVIEKFLFDYLNGK